MLRRMRARKAEEGGLADRRRFGEGRDASGSAGRAAIAAALRRGFLAGAARSLLCSQSSPARPSLTRCPLFYSAFSPTQPGSTGLSMRRAI
ncbi:MAG: hypothetical protein Tsb0010_00280 [Parvularculaceae bacterium]